MQSRPTRLLAGLASLGVTAATFALPAGPAVAAGESARQQAYSTASQEFGVPVDILLGVSYMESRWDANAGLPSISAGFGPMHLTDAAAVAAMPVAPDETAPAQDARGDDSRPAKPDIE